VIFVNRERDACRNVSGENFPAGLSHSRPSLEVWGGVLSSALQASTLTPNKR